MTQSEIKEIINVKDEVILLEQLLTERISDLHEVKGGMQARHAYIYYRKLVWDIEKSLRDIIERAGTSELQEKL